MSAPPAVVPFVGREFELGRLAETFVAVKAGSARVVLVSGEPGAGKSALVSEACARLAGQAQVAVGGCVDIPGVDSAQVPFGPFVEALRRLLRAGLGESAGIAVDRWLNPSPDRDHGDQDPVHTRFTGLLSLLYQLAGERPLVLVLEDLHWADPSSLALLVFLARNFGAERVLLIATTRTQLQLDSAAQATFDHLLRVSLASTIVLGPLPGDNILRIVQASAPGPLPEDDAAVIVLRAEGNPLVARELAGNPHPAGAGAEGAWVPPTLAASVRDRVRRCSPPARAVLAATAVLGGTADAAVVDAMLGAALPDLTPAGHRAAVREASATGLLLADGDGYRFRHGLDREVIYADLWPDQRRQLHTEAAEQLAVQANVDRTGTAARLATHWQQTGNHEATCHYSLIAARTSTQLSAYPEAHAHYERALAHWAVPINSTEENGGPGFDLLLEIAETAALAGQVDRGLELADAAGAVAATVEQAEQAVECLVRFSTDGGDSATALAIFEQAFTGIGNDVPSSVAAQVLASRSRSLVRLGRYAESADMAREALAAVTNEADSAKSSALITLGLVVAVTDPDEGLELLRQGRANAQAHGHVAEFWRAQEKAVYVLGSLARYQDAADIVLESLASNPTGAQAKGASPASLGAFANAAACLILLGQWPLADSVLAEGLARPHRPREASWLLAQQAQLKLLIGEADAAQALLSKARAHTVSVTDSEPIAHCNAMTAELALHVGDGVAARVAIDEAVALAAAHTEDPQLLLEHLRVAIRIEVADVAGLSDPNRLNSLHDLLSTSAVHLSGQQIHARLNATLCAADLARAGGTDDQDMWQRLADEAGELTRPYLRAYALLHLAGAAVRAKNRRAARPALAEAHRIAVGLGAIPLAQQIEQTARRLRVPINGLRSKTAALGLTDREVEVLRLLVEGQTNRQIARQLGMAEKTASVHVSRILAKLGCATRGTAAAAAQRLQLLDD